VNELVGLRVASTPSASKRGRVTLYPALAPVGEMTVTEILATGASIIASLGGGAAIVFGFSNYFGKVWADRALEKQRQENAKLNLEFAHQLGLVTERAKSAHQIRAAEHQVRFAKLHEKRAQVIWDLYTSLQDAWLVSERFILFDGYKADKEKQRETYPQINTRFLELLNIVEKNRICLPESLCASLENAVIAVRKIVVGVECYGSAAETVEQKHQVLTDAMKAFDRDVPVAKKALVGEFRKILGVENG
jgi:hypothetical protein